MKKIIALAVIAAALTGCAAPRPITMQAAGGSKADGTVRLSYSYGMWSKPPVDWQASAAAAARRCAAWGYTNAEPFDTGTVVCTQNSQYGCMATTVTVEYQCTGGAK